MFNLWDRLQLSKTKLIAAIGLFLITILAFSWTISDRPYLLENPNYLFGKPSDEIIIKSLPSLRDIDYRPLKLLLQAKQWEKADRETKTVLAKTLSSDYEDLLLLQKNQIQKIPCTDLVTIDRLWKKFSNGQFGFGVQGRIVENDNSLPSPKEIKQFCLRQCPHETFRTLEEIRCKRNCENQRIEAKYERIPEKMGRGRLPVGSQLPAGYYPSPIEIMGLHKADTYREFTKRIAQCKV